MTIMPDKSPEKRKTLRLLISIIFFLYEIKTTRKALLYSLNSLIVIYLVTLLFTAPDKEVNYVFSENLPLGIPYHTALWIPLAFILLVLPTYFIQKSSQKKKPLRHKT